MIASPHASDLLALTDADLLDLLAKVKLAQAEEFTYARGGEVGSRPATVEDARFQTRKLLAERDLPDPEVVRFVLHQRFGIRRAVEE
jgi:hypothetical protein